MDEKQLGPLLRYRRRVDALETALQHIACWAGMRCDDDVTREQNLAGIERIARDALAGATSRRSEGWRAYMHLGRRYVAAEPGSREQAAAVEAMGDALRLAGAARKSAAARLAAGWSEAEYAAALARIAAGVDARHGTPEAAEVDALVDAVFAYEWRVLGIDSLAASER